MPREPGSDAPCGEIEIRFAGSGGQGLQLSARLLAETVMREGRSVALSQSYEPTSRGGVSRCDVVVGDGEAAYPLVTALDYLVVLDDIAVATSLPVLRADGVVVADARKVETIAARAAAVHRLPCCDIARALGNERVANVVALGALAALSGLVGRPMLEAVLRAETPAKFLDLNLEALAAGYRLVAGSAAAVAGR